MSKRRRLLTTLLILVPILLLAGYLLLSRFPALGAQMAKPLRGLIGNEGVAQLETIFFTLQDTAKQTQHQTGLAKVEAPWQITAVPPTHTPTRPPTPSPSPTATLTPRPDDTPAPTAVPSPTPIPSPTFTSTPAPWSLPAIPAFGSLAGEGIWQPYLTNSDGEVVALRTFLQPDPERPYALVAIVAFDLRRTNLHYVLGSEEPALPDGPRGHGRMNATHQQPGILLATFNGGFMGSHGAYGAMADGFVALPAKNGYATVSIDADGRVQIGEWGSDVSAEGDYQSWRQNARLITQAGEITDRVYNGSAATWGSSINGDIVTWRSALGLSQDEQVLYFAAGPSLSMPSLAEAMQAAGAYNSLLLDINESWVHFAAIHTEGDTLVAEPLLPEGMDSNPDRYLKQSQRDFFYITAVP